VVLKIGLVLDFTGKFAVQPQSVKTLGLGIFPFLKQSLAVLRYNNRQEKLFNARYRK